MPGHIHGSALDGLIVFATVVVCGFLWRSAAMHYADRPIGQAMAFIY